MLSTVIPDTARTVAFVLITAYGVIGLSYCFAKRCGQLAWEAVSPTVDRVVYRFKLLRTSYVIHMGKARVTWVIDQYKAAMDQLAHDYRYQPRHAKGDVDVL